MNSPISQVPLRWLCQMDAKRILQGFDDLAGTHRAVRESSKTLGPSGAFHLTINVPFIVGCSVQMYVNSPLCFALNFHDFPSAI